MKEIRQLPKNILPVIRDHVEDSLSVTLCVCRVRIQHQGR